MFTKFIFEIVPYNFIYLLQIGLINNKIGPYFSYFEIGLSNFWNFKLDKKNLGLIVLIFLDYIMLNFLGYIILLIL